jgi:hypothetical protein
MKVTGSDSLIFRGGAACRIWRAVLQHRERARFSGYLSPMVRSRQNSVDDFHSGLADELYTVAEMT